MEINNPDALVIGGNFTAQTDTKKDDTEQTVFELMDCGKENCGAWHDGKCCYAAVSLCNE